MGNALNLPSIDGHFWVERDGEIVDWTYEKFNEHLSELYGCSDFLTMRLEAPPETSKIIIEIFKKRAMTALNTTSWEDTVKHFYDNFIEYRTPTQGRCFENCIIEIYKNGGELKFGSWGLEIFHEGTDEDDGAVCPCGKCDGIDEHWEYGGYAYKTVSDFLN